MKLRRKGACPELLDLPFDSDTDWEEYSDDGLAVLEEEGSDGEGPSDADSNSEQDSEEGSEAGSQEAEVEHLGGSAEEPAVATGTSTQQEHSPAVDADCAHAHAQPSCGTQEQLTLVGSSSTSAAHAASAAAAGGPAGSSRQAQVFRKEYHSCWVCFEDGVYVGSPHESEQPSCSHAHHAAARQMDDSYSSDRLESGLQEEGHAAERLLVPCSVCCGSMRYMHQHCLARWLSQSWSPNCPNCKNPLTRPALEAVPAGRLLAMLLDGLQAACTQAEQFASSACNTCPYHASLSSQKQLFPCGCVVSFALGSRNGQVHVDLPCAYLGVTAVAQQVAAIATEVMHGTTNYETDAPRTSTPDPMTALSGVKLAVTVLPPETSKYGGCYDLVSGVAYATYVRPQDVPRLPQFAAMHAHDESVAEDWEPEWEHDGADALLLWQSLLERRNGTLNGSESDSVSPTDAGFDRHHAPAVGYDRPSLHRYSHGLARDYEPWPGPWPSASSSHRDRSAWWSALLEDDSMSPVNALSSSRFSWSDMRGAILRSATLTMPLGPLPPTPTMPERPSTRNAWARQQLQQPGQARAMATELQRVLHGGGGRVANGPRRAQKQHVQPRSQPSRRNQPHMKMQAGGRRKS